MDRLDPERWLHPAENSLLVLTNTRAEEENLLDEHFRPLPPIIQFSNETFLRRAAPHHDRSVHRGSGTEGTWSSAFVAALQPNSLGFRPGTRTTLGGAAEC